MATLRRGEACAHDVPARLCTPRYRAVYARPRAVPQHKKDET